MLLIVMSISEPEAWSLSTGKLKVSNIETSSSDDSSDDEQLFSKTTHHSHKQYHHQSFYFQFVARVHLFDTINMFVVEATQVYFFFSFLIYFFHQHQIAR